MGRRKKSEGAPLSLFSFQDIMACLTGILILIALLLAVDGLSDEMQATPGKAGSPEAAAEAAKAVREAEARIEELARRRDLLREEIERRRAGRPVSEEEVRINETRARQAEEERAQAERRLAAARQERERAVEEAGSVDQLLKETRERLAKAERESKQQELRQRVRFRPGEAFAKAPVLVEAMAAGVAVGELDAAKAPALVADFRDPGADERAIALLRRLDPASDYLVFVVHEDAIARFAGLRRRLPGFEEGWQLWDGTGSMLDGAPPGPRAASGVAGRAAPAAAASAPGSAAAEPAPAGGAP
jgi:hypothetical protein